LNDSKIKSDLVQKNSISLDDYGLPLGLSEDAQKNKEIKTLRSIIKQDSTNL